MCVKYLCDKCLQTFTHLTSLQPYYPHLTTATKKRKLRNVSVGPMGHVDWSMVRTREEVRVLLNLPDILFYTSRSSQR